MFNKSKLFFFSISFLLLNFLLPFLCLTLTSIKNGIKIHKVGKWEKVVVENKEEKLEMEQKFEDR
jgi:hypothetical protein